MWLRVPELVDEAVLRLEVAVDQRGRPRAAVAEGSVIMLTLSLHRY